MRITFLFLIINFSLTAQSFPNLLTPSKVTTVSYWMQNESVNYTVKKASTSYKGDSKKPRKTEEAFYSFNLKVTDSTEKSYDLEMKYGKFNYGKTSDPIMNELTSLQGGMTIRYRTDELGIFDTILNLAELKAQLFAGLDEVRTLTISKIKDLEERKFYQEIMEISVENFQDIENIEALFLMDIMPLHGYAGIEMELSKQQDIDMYYPCIGDFILTGTGKLTLNSISKVSDECSFISNEKPDPTELKAYFKMIARIFFIDINRKPDESEVTITMSTKNKMKMELSTGWMKKINIVSTINVKDKKNNWKKIQTLEYVKQ